MKERGILFSAPMVRALLAGAKTQTRRIVRELPGNRGAPVGDHVKWFERGQQDATRWCGHDGLGSLGWVRCPYGEPGDRLWVRESWRTVCSLDDIRPAVLAETVPIHYDADDANRGRFREPVGRGRPGIHMPRWASRIELGITEVRVQRLREITEDDARAEGMPVGEMVEAMVNDEPGRAVFFNARDAFAYLWAGIHGPESWKASPWVWAITFKYIGAKSEAA